MGIEAGLLKKLKALKAKADGSEFMGEADAFMAKVREMLDKHGLSQSDIEIDNNPMGEDVDSIEWLKSNDWQAGLAGALARYFDCELVYYYDYKRMRHVGTVIGREGARITFKYMFPFIVDEVARKAKNISKRGDTARRAVGKALTLKIYRMIRAREASSTPCGEVGLMVVAENDAWLAKYHPDVQVARGQMQAAPDFAAQRAAAEINISEQVSQARRKNTLRIDG